MTPPRVLIVEDDVDIGHLLATSLTSAGMMTSLAETAGAGLAAARRDLPNLIVLDLLLPDGSGLDVCRALKSGSATQGIRVIILSALHTEDDRLLGLQLGADDYVAKPFSVREFVLRVRAVLRRGPAGPARSDLLTHGLLSINTSARRVFVDGIEALLTYLEFELLLVLTTRIDRVQTRDALIAQVWVEPPPESGRTLDMHITRMRRKLGPAGAYVRSVRGVGYRFALDT